MVSSRLLVLFLVLIFLIQIYNIVIAIVTLNSSVMSERYPYLMIAISGLVILLYLFLVAIEFACEFRRMKYYLSILIIICFMAASWILLAIVDELRDRYPLRDS